jgi:exosome complex RNA-binding protein Rrp4
MIEIWVWLNCINKHNVYLTKLLTYYLCEYAHRSQLIDLLRERLRQRVASLEENRVL